MLGLIFLLSFPYGEVILDVEVEGLQEVDTSLVVRSSGFSAGEILTREKGIEAIKSLYMTGFFSDVKLNAERKGGGIKVIIYVEENPRLKSLEFEGNEKLSDGDISSLVDLSPPALLSDYKLHRIKEKIYNLYEEKGFSGTEVSISREIEKDGASVIFHIDEGAQYKVKKINFIGNEALSDHALSKVLSNKTKTWWLFWRDNSLKLDSLEGDAAKVEALYRKNGYLGAEVDSFYVDYEDNNAIINYVVDEGKLYYFGKTHLQGTEDLGFISTRIKWEEGEIFNEEKIQKTIEDLSIFYSDHGFLNAAIVPEYSIVKDTIVEIDLYVDKGDPVYVRLVKIKGNHKTYDKVIRRNTVIYPGVLFQRNKIMHSYRNVYRLNYFSNIKVDMEPTSSPDSLDLILEVVEKTTGQFSGTVGFSGTYGFTGGVSVSMPNVFGTGQSFSFNFERSLSTYQDKSLQNLSLSWSQPWLFDTPTSAGFSVYNTYWQRPTYSVRKLGASLSAGRFLNEERNLRAMFTYRLERNELKISEEYEDVDTGMTWESSLRGDLTFDSRDSKIAPSVGSYYSLDAKYAGGVLGGDRRYFKLILEARKFHSLVEDLVIMNRTRIGYAASPPGKDIPLLERFLLGGAGSWGLRGYDDETIIPELTKSYVGGNFAFLNNFEIRLNFGNTGYGMIFLDAGNCYESLQEADMSDLFYGVGVGFRAEVPMMGIFGIDFGYNLNLFEGKREWSPHFQLGTTF